MTSAGKLRSKRPPPGESFLARFLEEHPLSSELPEPEGRSNSLAPQSEGGYLSLLLAFQQAVSSDAFSMPFDL